ncbi:EAL domain-containing protein [Parasphingorhabdus sp.]|uniref:sensor domain-containing phosphodiesterase n=1 Tax=Parasphingorhabdus sp. TaxID=2709688 RepID=UPI003A9540BF
MADMKNNALAKLLSRSEIANESAAAESIQEILVALREHLKMDIAFVSEFKDGRRVFLSVNSASGEAPIKAGDSDPIEESYCHLITEGQLPEIIMDTSLIPKADSLAVTSALSIGAYLGVPLRFSDGRLFGTFCCLSHRPDITLHDRDLSLMKVFGPIIAGILERRSEEQKRRNTITTDISKMIDSRQFMTVYQTIHKAFDGSPVGLEALTRFADSEVRSPADWFEEASEVGLGVELELALIRNAVAGLRYFPNHIYLTLNASAETIISGKLDEILRGVPQERLVIELTEHEAVENYTELQKHLQPLRDRVRFAIDDVGAGFSSLRHILILEPDIIKLDASLIHNLHEDPKRIALVQALVTFAKSLDIILVAEGVECEDELNELRKLGVDKVQGYFFSRPMPLLAASHFLCFDPDIRGPQTAADQVKSTTRGVAVDVNDPNLPVAESTNFRPQKGRLTSKC